MRTSCRDLATLFYSREGDPLPGRPDIVNMSFGGYTANAKSPACLTQAFHRLHSDFPDTIFIAAAGNDSTDWPFYPAASPHVIAVGATDEQGRPRDWSNYGRWVDVCTNGENLVSDYFERRVTFMGETAPHSFTGVAAWSGTSFAAPSLAGRTAEYMEKYGLGARAAFELLVATAPPKIQDVDGAYQNYGVWVGQPRAR